MSAIDVKENLRTMLAEREENTTAVRFNLSDGEFEASGDGVVLSIKNDEVDESVLLTDEAFEQITKHLEIPTPFAKRIDDNLFNHVMNYQAHSASAKDGHDFALDTQLALITDGRVRTFADVDRPYVPAARVFETLENVFEGDYDLRYVGVGDDRMKFSILPQQYQNSLDGSNLYGGLKVVFSETWSVFPQFDAYIWRELCSNGMVNELEGHKFRVNGKDPDQVIEQIETFAKLSLDKLPELFDNFNKLLTESVGDPRKLIARICAERRLSNKIRERLYFWSEQIEFLITITDQQITNMNDVVNLITWVASHDAVLSQDNKDLLMGIAGNLTMAHDDRCNSCGVTL
jgi:hypothetical protein